MGGDEPWGDTMLPYCTLNSPEWLGKSDMIRLTLLERFTISKHFDSLWIPLSVIPVYLTVRVLRAAIADESSQKLPKCLN